MSADNAGKPAANNQTDEMSQSPEEWNPHHFPASVVSRGLTFNGSTFFCGPVQDDPLTHVQNIRALQIRSDDVIIAAFPKCGTHWLCEITHMLTRNTTSHSERTKVFTMLEFVNDLSNLDGETSPRLLNSHLYMNHLPEQIVDKKVKIIHAIRNPKDVAVSFFHQLKQAASPEFTFESFFKGYTTPNYLVFGNQCEYLHQMSEFESTYPDHPILHVHYEDLKRDPVTTIQTLAKFLQISASETRCQEIAAACEFNTMKAVDQDRPDPEHLARVMPGRKKMSIYRKGVVGDWKNMFTVAQSEVFDEYISAQGKLPYSFKYN